MDGPGLGGLTRAVHRQVCGHRKSGCVLFLYRCDLFYIS
jgi:hypothetical protein